MGGTSFVKLHVAALGVLLAASVWSLGCDGRGLPAAPAPGPPASLSIAAGDGQSAVAATSVRVAPSVIAKDANGNTIPEVPVTFTVASGGGQVAGTAAEFIASTNAGGVATVNLWTLGTAPGANTLTATATGIPAATFHATALSGARSTLSLDQTEISAGGKVSVTVDVKDPAGNPAEGAAPHTTALTGKLGGQFGAVTCANSRCVATYMATAAGSDTIFAAIGNENIMNSPAALAVTPGGAAKIAFLTPPATSAENGKVLMRQPVVQVQDEFGNPVREAGTIVHVSQVAGSGPGVLGISNDTTRTTSEGIATFSGISLTGPVGNGYRLAFAILSAPTIASDPISLALGAPYKLFLRTPAAGVVLGSPFATQPVLQVSDAGDNLVSVADCVTASISSFASLIGNTSVAGTGTLAYLDLGLSTSTPPGTYTITYASGCPCSQPYLFAASQSIQSP